MRFEVKILSLALAILLTAQLAAPCYATEYTAVSGTPVTSATESTIPASAASATGAPSPAQEPTATDAAEQENGETATQTQAAQVSAMQMYAPVLLSGGDGYTYNTATELVTALDANGNATNVTVEAEKLSVATIQTPEGFAILSNADPALYKNAALTVNYTGVLDLTQTTFRGLGSDEYPFAGTFNGAPWFFYIKCPFFNAIDAGIDLPAGFTLAWKGACNSDDVMLAKRVTGTATDTDWNITINAEKIDTNSPAIFPGLIGTVDVTGNLSLNVTYENDIQASTTATENAGLLCNTLESGTLTVAALSNLPTATSISAGGYAGGLVGEMASGTTLAVPQGVTMTDGLTVTGTRGAGGLVGAVGAGCTLALGNVITGGTMTATATDGCVGGLLGTATDVTITMTTATDTIMVSNTNVTGRYAGGLMGSYTYSGGDALRSIGTQVAVDGVNLSCNQASGAAGGLFGVLNLGGDFTIAADDRAFGSTLSAGRADTVYGGLVGAVTETSGTDDALHSLCLGTPTGVSAGITVTGTAGYSGGLVGSATNVYMPVSNAVATATSVVEQNTVFGGAVGRLDADAVLDVSSLTVSGVYNAGGGVVGEANSGAVVRLGGVVDLSDTTPTGIRAAQIVGKQDGALIFATDEAVSALKRCRSGRSNDILNYGEVIRLGTGLASDTGLSDDLITLDTNTHKAVLKSGVLDNVSGTTITLSDADQFALLAIMIQTDGAFSSAGAVTAATLLQKDITLDADISLAGTGILGLMRDYSADGVGSYSGTFDGGGHTLELAIGEAWAATMSANQGSGQIYNRTETSNPRHDRVGLFSSIDGATFKDVTIAGSARLGADQSNGDMSFGALAANATGTNASTWNTIGDSAASGTDVTTRVSVSASGSKAAFIGGLLGHIVNENVTFAKVAGEAILTNTGTGDEIRLGGLVGRLSAGTVTVGTGTTLGGSISTNATINAKVGGLIADTPVDDAARTIYINDLTVDGLSVSAMASGSCGGLLGYEWDKTNVTFDEAGIGKGLTVKETSTATPTAVANTGTAGFGGLVYRASGYWRVNKLAMTKASFTTTGATNCGLLVCHGDPAGSNTQALYLELTSDSAYTIGSDNTGSGISVSTGGTVFDELVAYTAPNASAIVNNGNGVISIATAEQPVGTRTGIDLTTGGCNTYQNKTTNNGTTPWAQNPNSRYYYNLDKYRSTSIADGTIDTPEKLLLWSVGRYAANNIKNKFGGYTSGNTCIMRGNLDLRGYSYYPVSLNENDSVSVDGAAITFDNATIETAETATGTGLDDLQRLTSGSLSSHSQHYLMHCGLFYNFTYNGTPNEYRTCTLRVNNTSISGSVGMTDFSNSKYTTSGALLCGSVAGKVGVGCAATMAVEVTTATLTDLVVNKMASTTDYAPMLINTVGNYSSLTVSGVNTGSRGATAPYAATSLIGKVGNKNATNIALSFSGLKLEGEKASSVFSKATILEWFQYKELCSGTYTFMLEEDWATPTDLHAPYNVTYGREISDSLEYNNQQRYYYNTQDGENMLCVNPEEYPTATPTSFSGFLPYVANTKITNASATDIMHELKVNIPAANLLNGCGTYSDPYVITNENELIAVANYLKTGESPNNWKINMDADVSQDPCDGTNGHATYTLLGTNWTASGTSMIADNGREYIRNAYYQIGNEEQETVTISSSEFEGLGTGGTAFRGVIIGYSDNDTKRTTLTIASSCNVTGLINYSYGCVVKRLTIKYDGTRTVEEAGFGGVMNHVLGGDNIIDNVTVEGSVSTPSDIPYLAGVGGYVGMVEGGGVIFRNMTDGEGWSDLGSDTNAFKFYQNPFVGRVLDGFAFYEKRSTATNVVASLTNTDKNYTIATLNTGDVNSITTTSENTNPTAADKKAYPTTTVSSAQGLLILSAIANSGAGAYGATLAYFGTSSGTYGNGDNGKVRNASYDAIGCKGTDSDIALAVTDDTSAPFASTVGSSRNTPYLITKYTDSSGLTMLLCATFTRFNLVLAHANYDMSAYGNGFRGVGGRYRSKAVALKGNNVYNADRYTPYINTIRGNGNVLVVNQTVAEYSDDTYPAMAVGGFMPFLQQLDVDNSSYLIDNMTVSGEVSLRYYNAAGAETNIHKNNVGVGGVFGRSANREGRDNTFVSSIDNITLSELKVTAPENAGGLFGGIGMQGAYAAGNIKHTTDNNNVFAVKLTNCTYENLTVTSGKYAGGFIGYSGANGNASTATNVGTNTIRATDTDYTAICSGTNLVSATNSAGGLIGYSQIGLDVKTEGTAENPVTQLLTLDGLQVTGRYAGALVGQQEGHANWTGWTPERSAVVDGVGVDNCTITGTSACGGLFGSVLAAKAVVTDSKVEGSTVGGTGANSGALLGELKESSGTLEGANLLWKNNTITGGTSKAGNWVGVGKGRTIRLAGVSRQATTDDAQSAVLENDIGDTSYADQTGASYIAYADYLGMNNGGTGMISVPRDTYAAVNNFGIPVATSGNITLALGEKAMVSGTAISTDNNAVTSSETGGNLLVTAVNVGIATAGDVTITVTDTSIRTEERTTTISSGTNYYGEDGREDVSDIAKGNDFNHSIPYYTYGYVTHGGLALNRTSNQSCVLVLPVSGNETYRISFAMGGTSRDATNGTRFRVAFYTGKPTPDEKPDSNSSAYLFYVSRYDKDYYTSGMNDPAPFDVATDPVTLYATFEGKKYKKDGALTGTRYTDASLASATSPDTTITFPNDGYIVIVYRNSKMSEGTEPRNALPPTGIKVEKYAAATTTQTPVTYSDIVLGTNSNLKTAFVAGDTFTCSGLTVWGKNAATDGYTQLTTEQYTVELAGDPSMAAPGLKTVTVSLTGDPSVTDTYQIAVNETDLQWDTGNTGLVRVTTSPIAASGSNLYTVPNLLVASDPVLHSSVPLYGDGVIWTGSGTATNLIAQRIKTDGTAESYRYTHQGVGIAANKLSSFADCNSGVTGLPSDTIPVLKVSGGQDARILEDVEAYLDTVTNGGYSHAKTLDSVTLAAETYAWNGTDFTRYWDGTEVTQTPISNTIQFRSGTLQTGSRYDNSEGKLSILSATFKSNGTDAYTVYVPIVVERLLDVDFMATFQNGTTFLPSSYEDPGLYQGVIESHGNAITAYVSYLYNSQYGTGKEYSWDTFMSGGGDLSQPFEKTISFGCDFPEDTKFLLVDCQNDDKVYQYATSTTVSALQLSDFYDGDGNHFASAAISDLIGAVASQTNEGGYVRTSDADATVKCGESYYKPATADDSEAPHYSITITMNCPSENYYIVIRTPEPVADNPMAAITGKLGTTIPIPNAMPKHINTVARTKNYESISDSAANKENSFRMSTGYEQVLTDEIASENTEVLAEQSFETAVLVSDTITSTQVYRTFDKLYQEFQVDWTIQTDGNAKTTAFPVGSDVTVTFTVKSGNTYYYYVAETGWIETNERANGNTVSGSYVGSKERADNVSFTPLSYSREADGNPLTLIVGTDDETAVDLSVVRDASSRNFTVEMAMDIQMTAEEARAVIPAGQLDNNMPNPHAFLRYTSRLSSTAESLSYSTLSENKDGNRRYFMETTGEATLKYSAADITQLGINLGDEEEAAESVHSILTRAVYNLSGVEDIDEKLASATSIRFMLTAQRRGDSNQSTYESVGGSEPLWDSVSSEGASWTNTQGNANVWSYTIEKDENGIFAHYNSLTNTLTLPIALGVRTDLRGAVGAQPFFANYRAALTVRLVMPGDAIDEATDYITYTITSITPEFVT